MKEVDIEKIRKIQKYKQKEDKPSIGKLLRKGK